MAGEAKRSGARRAIAVNRGKAITMSEKLRFAVLGGEAARPRRTGRRSGEPEIAADYRPKTPVRATTPSPAPPERPAPSEGLRGSPPGRRLPLPDGARAYGASGSD